MQMIFLQIFENDRGSLTFDRGSPLVIFFYWGVPAGLFFHRGGSRRGSWPGCLSAQALFEIAARAQTLFDIAAQRSDPLLPLSAPPFFDISAQRSYLILDRRSALKTSISAR